MPTDTAMRTWSLAGVEIFDVGKWNGRDWTDADLDEIVANFGTIGLDVPIKLGHGEQKLLQSEGLPAAGWITRLYRSGTKLAADIEEIPDEVYQLLERGAYKNVSAEIWTSISFDGQRYENVLAAVAFLGAELPAVATLGDILDLYGAVTFRAEPDTQLVSHIRRVSMHRSARRMHSHREEPMSTAHAKDSVDDEASELLSTMEKLAERSTDATKGKTGAPAFRAFLRETLTKLRGLMTTEHAGATGTEERDMATTNAILAALGLPETADDGAIVKAIEDLKAERTNHSATADRVTKLEGELAKRDAKDAVEAAIRARKLAPAQREWAEAYAAKDPAGFTAYVAKAPELFKAGEAGSAADAPEPKSAGEQLSEHIAAARKADPALSFAAAMDKVTSEHPELVRQYRQEGRTPAAARS